MTERERRALLRRRPNVVSWRDLLETAREEHLRVTVDTQAPAPVSARAS
jgi:WhiB family redox-sensing transcriptional regulator